MSWTTIIPAALALVGVSLTEPLPTTVDGVLNAVAGVPGIEQVLPDEVAAALDRLGVSMSDLPTPSGSTGGSATTSGSTPTVTKGLVASTSPEPSTRSSKRDPMTVADRVAKPTRTVAPTVTKRAPAATPSTRAPSTPPTTKVPAATPVSKDEPLGQWVRGQTVRGRALAEAIRVEKARRGR